MKCHLQLRLKGSQNNCRRIVENDLSTGLPAMVQCSIMSLVFSIRMNMLQQQIL